MALTDTVQSQLQGYYRKHIQPDATITDVEALADGWETDVYAYRLQSAGDVRSLILRVYNGGQYSLDRARNEFHVMKTLHAVGYPVPEVFHFEPSEADLGGAFLIMERVPGTTLRSQLAHNQTELLNLLCGLLVDLHRVDWRRFVGEGSPWPTREAAEATFGLEFLAQVADQHGLSKAFQPVLDWLADQGRTIEMRAAVVHGDFHPLNIIMAPGGSPTVIDWGSASVADPRVDVANAMILAHVLGQPELATAIRNGYEAIAGELHDLDYFMALVLSRRLATMVTVMVHGAGSLGLRAGTEEHLRRHGHLARSVLAWVSDLTGLDLVELKHVLSPFE